MKSETVILHRWEQEGCNIKVKLHLGKFQGHMDVLLCLPLEPQENCTTIMLLDDVWAELREWGSKTR